jgi:signal transduction histidine kinase/DNA-binding NarL/FixJ family response regulator/HPt (histidine-containing phosphotransfer) domain-containing protein
MTENATPARWPRWLAFGGALATLGALGAPLAGIAGPWNVLALGSAALALAGAGMALGSGGGGAGRRARPVDDNVEQLRAELEKHKALERELIIAKQAAEAAMMSKGEFLATMSHEIRTPLNGVIPLLDILLSSPMPPDQRDIVSTAFGSAKQLLRIVDDILDYSKLEANKLDLETVGINLKDVLEGVMRLMERAAENKGLRLVLHIDPAVRLAVRGDPVRLRQVLTNLVSNAIKFTDRGSVTINVTRRAETRTQHELRFDVRDTGVGIAPEAAAKLFQPFSQAESSTTRTYGGTGLGLVICKRIVDLMGGQIGVESERGRGSLFWFQIPMLKALGDIGTRKRDINGARVLLVTANAAQQRRFTMALPQWGAMVVHAGATQEAIAKLRAAAGRSSSWSFDLMLVDAGSIPTTVQALHRSVMREASLEDLRVVYLRGDDDLPGEIVEGERVRILMRETADSELRSQLLRTLDNEQPRAIGATPGAEMPEAPAPSTPRTAVAAAAARKVTPVRATLGPDQPIRGHVLLVEDNPVNRQVAQRLLALAGLSIDCAENGREAVDRIAATRYDAVLMDCQMPVMDGYTATRQIRANEAIQEQPHLPIIAMTANAMVGDREKCLASGMDDYLSKPLNRGLLEETLRRWLPAEPVGQPAPAPTPAPPPVARAPASAGGAMPPRPSSFPSAIARASTPRPGIPLPSVPDAAVAAALPASAAPARPSVREIMARGAAAPAQAPAAAIERPARVAPTPAPRPPMAAPPPAAHTPMRSAPPPASSAPVLNREIVDDLREIMGEEFIALVRVFLEDAPRALQKLEAAAARSDIDALVGPAHSLKSTSANLGALALSDLARTIEHGARQRNLADPGETVGALGREFHRVEAALRGFLG